MNKMTAAEAASQTVANLVAKGMSLQEAATYVVERLTAERPELAAKVFAGLVAA